MADTSNKKNIREESLRDLSDFLTAQGEKAFRAKQIWQWIWQRGVTDFAETVSYTHLVISYRTNFLIRGRA